MTPLQLVLPAVQVAGAVMITRRVSAAKHPALVSLLASEALWQVFASFNRPIAFQISLPIQMAIRTAVVYEVAKFARTPRSKWEWVRWLAISAIWTAVVANGLSARQTIYLFRSNYHLLLAFAIGVDAICRWYSPILECARHRIYRTGAAAWLAVIAIAGSFVRGGLGYAVFPHTRAVWDWVNLATYTVLGLVIGIMSLAIAATVPPRNVTVRAVAAVRRQVAA